MTVPRILIACIGNIFLGDDAFGVEVARELAFRPMPPSVRVVDFGIRGMDLTYALLDDCDVAILVDAAPRGQAPGTLYLIEPDPMSAAHAGDDAAAGEIMIDPHSMDPAKVLRLVSALGGNLQSVFVVGCEPSPLDHQDMEIGISDAVRTAIPSAIAMVESLVEQICGGWLKPAAIIGAPAPVGCAKGVC